MWINGRESSTVSPASLNVSWPASTMKLRLGSAEAAERSFRECMDAETVTLGTLARSYPRKTHRTAMGIGRLETILSPLQTEFTPAGKTTLFEALKVF